MLVTAIGSAALTLAADILPQLGLKEADAKDHVVHGIEFRGVSIPEASRKALLAATPEARARLAVGALAWLKTYTESSDFKSRYAKPRETHKPIPPKSGAEQLKQMQDEQRRQLAETKQSLAKML